ncbi:MAG: glycosyltransferase family 9 protein [Acidobacteria bacterium]|nr:glycosyltransferase family 9 protein [Acidobacteriota bacterium]
MRLRLVGDVVFTTPAIHALRRHFPAARLDYLVEPAAAAVVRHSPDLDAVIEVARPRGLARLAYDIGLARRLRRTGYDLALDFHGGPRSAWLVRASGAPRRIGYDIPGRRFAYTDHVPWHPDLVPPRHSVLNQWDLLTPLGLAAPTPSGDPVRMTPGAEAERAAAARLAGAGVAADAPLVVLHVSASNPFRRWPRESFAQVAGALALANPRRRIMITAGPSETDAADAIAAGAAGAAGTAAGAIVRCGDPPLDELQVIMSRATLFIGGDSGPLHVAATTGVPILALFGPTLPARSMPWRDPAAPADALEPGPLACRPCHQRVCVHGDFRCLTATTPAQVVAAAHRLLGAGA